MSASERLISASDYLLYKRCPRSLHTLLSGGTLPSASEADDEFPLESDRARVRAQLLSRYPNAISADSWRPASDEEELPAVLSGARCTYGRLTARADLWRTQRPSGRAAVLVREGTSIKEAYLREAAFLDFCFNRCDAQPARLVIVHVNKSYEREGELDPDQFLVERDVTKRVAALRATIRRELEELLEQLDDDPTLQFFEDVICRRPRSCPLCSKDVEAPGPARVESLHRGGHLAEELKLEGITRIADVPPERLSHPRQRIQQQSLLEDRAQVDFTALREFLDRLEFPRLYLDFEATSSAVPPFSRVRPWEHLPYLFSIHRDDGSFIVHRQFIARPGRDEREELAHSLLTELGEHGSVIVYSAGFERGVIGRLAEVVGDSASALERVLERIVDLLQPFHDFSFYHHQQGGKVSLKTVLPVLTSEDYSSEAIKDGYTANLAYRYLTERANLGDPPGQMQSVLNDLASYCAMDTLAMVRIVGALERLVRASGES